MQIAKLNTSLEVCKSVIETLPVGLQKYALAKQSPIVSQLSKVEGVKLISNLILKIIFDLGWKSQADKAEITEDDRIKTAADCFDLIKDRYVSLTIDEMKLAFLNGSLESYGAFYGLGLKTLSDWLKGYSNDELKKKAMAEYNRLIDLAQYATKSYSDSEKEDIEIGGALKYFEEYKSNGMLNQVLKMPDKLCSIYYLRLKTKIKIEFTPEKRAEMYAKAETEYQNSLERALKDPKVNFKKSDLEKILEVSAKDNKPFVSMCHRIALLEYFDFLISNNKHLKELLK